MSQVQLQNILTSYTEASEKQDEILQSIRKINSKLQDLLIDMKNTSINNNIVFTNNLNHLDDLHLQNEEHVLRNKKRKLIVSILAHQDTTDKCISFINHLLTFENK